MKFIWLFAALLAGSMNSTAFAQDLFYDNCVRAALNSNSELPMVVFVSAGHRAGPLGLRCEDVRQWSEAARTVELALYPATLAIALSPMKAELVAELAAMGLTMANPAVLGVTVLTATGAVVFYLVLKQTMEECDRMDQRLLRESIVRELERKYGLGGDPSAIKVMR